MGNTYNQPWPGKGSWPGQAGHGRVVGAAGRVVSAASWAGARPGHWGNWPSWGGHDQGIGVGS